MGIKAELIVCGCVPPRSVTHAALKVIPFLDKKDAQQARELEKLYSMTDFLILPTRADCAPNVFREASAFGLPVMTSDTGGIADVVHNGENGYILPFGARGEAFASIIADLYRDEQRYREMMYSSRAAYDERLNWDTWGNRVRDILVQEIGKADHTVAITSLERQ